MIVLSFLLMWGLTGAGYDVGFVAKAWYAALPGNDEHSHFKSAAPADEMNPVAGYHPAAGGRACGDAVPHLPTAELGH